MYVYYIILRKDKKTIMYIFDKHRSVKKNGYEIYKKNTFLIDLDTYNYKKNAIELCTHSIKEDGDYLLGTFSPGNNTIIYLPRYISKGDKIRVENIVKAYFKRR